MSRDPETKALVEALLGTWNGSGVGGYPTIEPFEFSETTVIEGRPDHPALHYQQRTWKLSEFGDVASHWETGLLRISSDGSVAFNNAQGGRSETMSGTWRVTDGGWTIDLASTGYAGDDRVMDSTRSLTVGKESLAYIHEMKTTATGEMSIHLKAELTRTAID